MTKFFNKLKKTTMGLFLANFPHFGSQKILWMKSIQNMSNEDTQKLKEYRKNYSNAKEKNSHMQKMNKGILIFGNTEIE